MAKRILSLILSCALLISCISGLTLVSVAEGNKPLVAKIDFSTGAAVGTNAKLNWNTMADISGMIANGTRPEFAVELNEAGMAEVDGAYGIVMYQQNTGFSVNFSDLGLTGQDVAVTVEYYLPADANVQNDTRFNMYINGKPYTLKVGGNGERTGNAPMTRGAWNIATFIVSGEDANAFKGSFNLEPICWNHNNEGYYSGNALNQNVEHTRDDGSTYTTTWGGDYYYIRSMSVMAASELNQPDGDYAYYDFVGEAQNPYYPDYKSPVKYGLDCKLDAGAGTIVPGQGLVMAEGEKYAWFSVKDELKGAQPLHLRLTFADGTTGKVDLGYQGVEGDVDGFWCFRDDHTIVNNQVEYFLGDAKFQNTLHQSTSIRLGDLYGKTLTRVEVWSDNEITTTNGAAFKLSKNENQGKIVAIGGQYAWAVNGTSKWVGIRDFNDILENSTSVTYEYDVMFVGGDNPAKNDGDTRVFLAYSENGSWHNVEEGKFREENGKYIGNQFHSNGNSGTIPAYGTWGTISIRNDRFDALNDENKSHSGGDLWFHSVVSALGIWAEGDTTVYVKGIRVKDNNDPSKVISIDFNKFADMDALWAEYIDAKANVTEGQYIAITYAKYEEALAAAEDVLYRVATKAEADKALADLKAARAALAPYYTLNNAEWNQANSNGTIELFGNTYAFKYTQGGNNWFGIKDPNGILANSTSVTYEYDLYFDTNDGNDRVFACYGATDRWHPVEDGNGTTALSCGGGWMPAGGSVETYDGTKEFRKKWITLKVVNNAFDPSKTDAGEITRLGSWVGAGSLYIKGLRVYDSTDRSKMVSITFNTISDELALEVTVDQLKKAIANAEANIPAGKSTYAVYQAKELLKKDNATILKEAAGTIAKLQDAINNPQDVLSVGYDSVINLITYKFMSGANRGPDDYQRVEGSGDDANSGHNHAGDYIDFEVNVTTAGYYDISFLVTTPDNNRSMELRDENNYVYGSVTFNATGSNGTEWSSYREFTFSTFLSDGQQILRVYFVNGNNNFRRIILRKDEDATAATKANLQSAVNFGASPSLYEEDSTAAYKAALDAAKEVLKKDQFDTYELDKEILKLNKAKNSLVSKYPDMPLPTWGEPKPTYTVFDGKYSMKLDNGGQGTSWNAQQIRQTLGLASGTVVDLEMVITCYWQKGSSSNDAYWQIDTTPETGGWFTPDRGQATMAQHGIYQADTWTTITISRENQKLVEGSDELFFKLGSMANDAAFYISGILYKVTLEDGTEKAVVFGYPILEPVYEEVKVDMPLNNSGDSTLVDFQDQKCIAFTKGDVEKKWEQGIIKNAFNLTGDAIADLDISVSYYWQESGNGGNDWWQFNTNDKNGESAPGLNNGNPHDNGFGTFNDYGMVRNKWSVLKISRKDQLISNSCDNLKIYVGNLGQGSALYISGIEYKATLKNGMVLTATWTAPEVKYYTVTWIVDGVEFKETYKEGATPSFKGSTDKAADAQYTYTFTGWDKDISPVTGEVTYTAQYSTTVNTYTVTWIVDGKETTETYEYGATPSFKGSTDKAADAQYTYTFDGWDKEIAAVTGPVTYTAQYTSTVNTYTVTWIVDGKETTEAYEYGATPSFKGSTDKAADAQYTYTFTGWDKDISPVTGEVTYTAQYSTTVNSYTVTWIVDGKETTETYEYGVTPTFKGSTDKAADAQYTYTFTGWDKDIAAVTGDMTYTAQYKTTTNSYTISWDTDGDGDVDDTTTVAYGEVPTHADGVKESTAQYTYTFTGWDPALVAVIGEATYTAQFSETVNTVAIGWDTDGDGEVDETTNVPYGELPTHADGVKDADNQFSYTFTGWDKEIVAATVATTYTAQFSKTGWIADETGKQYIVEDEVQKTGWTEIADEWYYLDTETGYAATGVVRLPYPTVAINGVTYAPNQEDIDSNRGYTDAESALFIFDVDGKFQYDQTGMCEYDLDGDSAVEKHWAINGQLPWFVGLVKDGDNYYYFRKDNTMSVSTVMYMWRNNTELEIAEGAACLVRADGTLLIADGIASYNDNLYYFQNNALVQNAGLVKMGDSYIYVTTNGELALGKYYVSRTNGYLTAGYYTFGDDGLMVAPGEKNGVVEKDDKLYYYENGKVTYKGLIAYGDGYIYVNSKGQVMTGKYYVSKTNGLMDPGYYTFGEDGVMLPEQELKNGVVEKDGVLYYYENGKTTYKGLTEYEGGLIYVNSKGQVVTGDYYVSKTNDLKPAGYYTFGEDGKLVVAALNGIVEKDGKLYYYENNQRTYKGLVAYEDGYIYVNSKGEVMTGKYFVSKTNGLMDMGYYTFGADGMMIQG